MEKYGQGREIVQIEGRLILIGKGIEEEGDKRSISIRNKVIYV